METILSSDLREQAGSNSFNRFDYQAHWIVYHMINEYKKNSEFFIFCEFHDDMAKTDISSSVPSCAEFFQIKTTEKYKEWTLTRLTNTTKKSNGKMNVRFVILSQISVWIKR
ncbi:dsDNA nuclease domain-containing protein [Priestia sp. YIM B13486]|uniref:dsDNA nuclease domain-containing protein n=1 Tax=Priestia sp. YIM B13486 TaxID=3366304 RepID=UPI00366B2647